MSSVEALRIRSSPRKLWRPGRLVGLGAGTLLAAALAFVAPARAAFPGRDGLLAVQPLSGPGIVLIGARGRGLRRVCARPFGPDDPCGVTSPSRLLRPRWSPDGGTLVVEKTADPPLGTFEVIYPDGSCLDCLGSPGGGWTDAAFTSDPTLLTVTSTVGRAGGPSYEALVEYGTDGLERRVLLSGAASGPAWSSRGQLALVRGGWIWVGRPGVLRRVTYGSAPSWSPDGRRLAFVRKGWLMIGSVHRRSFRRLVRGAAPAWSPDGGSIAFFDQRHRLGVVPATGGRSRRVGGVTGWTVDWQPLPPMSPAPCLTPAGSTVLASSDVAVVTASQGIAPYYPYPPGSATMGCLRADGRERLLSSSTWPAYPIAGGLSKVALAGPYAAFAANTFISHDQMWNSHVNLFDLRTGLGVPARGGEGSACLPTSSPPCATNIDQLVLGSDAVSAVHVTVTDANCGPPQAPNCRYTVEQIQASDRTGVHTLDTATRPDGSPPALTNLILTADALTWDDSGAQRSAQLEP